MRSANVINRLKQLAILSAIVLLALPVAAQTALLNETFPYDTSAPAVGQWVGDITADGEEPIFGQLIIEPVMSPDAAGSWSAWLTSFPFGAVRAACSDLAIDGSNLAFAHTIAGRTFRFVCEVDGSGQVLTGNVFEDDAAEPISQVHFGRRPRIAECNAPIYFTGSVQAGPIEIPMSIALATTEGGNWLGHLDVPAQMLRELPIINLVQGDDGYVTGDLPVPGGARFRLKINEETNRLDGALHQGGAEMAIDFPIDVNYEYKELVRPQNPTAPFPYTEREITVEHPAGFTLAGTLTIPDAEDFGPGPFPAAILISGSGQQDRDESLLGHKPFLIIADYLTRNGVAVMRYDDRGVGRSNVPSDRMDALVMNATSADFATDTVAIYDALAQQPEIDPGRIGLIGHSEGGLIAPLAAQQRPDVAYMVLLAGPGVRGDALLRKQLELMWVAAGADAAAIAPLLEGFGRVQQLIIDQADEAAMNDALTALTPMFVEAGLASEDQAAESDGPIDMGLSMLNSPWMRYFFSFDPAEALRAATCPILALNGEKDLQVWHEQNLDAIERTIRDAGGDVTAIRYADLNHLFQPCDTGHPAEYAAIETTFDERVLADIVKWLNDKGMK